MTGAAFFDLDRTLLAGASGEAFSTAMQTAGFTTRPIPGERLAYRLFNRIGETLPSMALARQAATMSRGRKRAAMRAAGEAAADGLVAMVQPFAGPIFEQHRQAGRPIILATTTPYDLVKPLADRLGLDDVIATKYGVNADDTYDGSIAGHFVWVRASWTPSATGRPSTASSSRRATPTPTASTTRRCSTPSVHRSSSTPILGWCSWRHRDAGRSSTSTCRPASSRSVLGIELQR